jgi:ethanolamine ammonia-lyase large subunit
LPVLTDGLAARNLSIGQPILIRYGRVKVAEDLAERLKAKLVILLIGERPGGDALASRSLSAYLVYPAVRFEYSVISNIYSGGLPALEAGSVVAEKAVQILSYRAAGNRLEALLKGR